MFSQKERKEILEELIVFMKSIGEVVGVILVGSASYGFKDEFSDLDFNIFVDTEADMFLVMDKIKEILLEKYDLVSFVEDRKTSKLQIGMLSNYLELNIGYQVYSETICTRENWKVVYDIHGDIKDRMVLSWQKTQSLIKGQLFIRDFDKVFKEYQNEIWYYFYCMIISLKRNEVFKAFGDLNAVRDLIIEVLGIKYELETTRYKLVDDFPKDIKQRLHETHPSEITYQAIKIVFIPLLDLAYDILKDDYPTLVSKEFIIKFYNEILSK